MHFIRSLALVTLLPAAALAADRGWFGFGVAVNADGFLAPTIQSIKVSKIADNSPASTAGLKVGDELVEVDGKAVAGAKARDLMAGLDKQVGQPLQVKVRRGDGSVAALTLTAGAKPQ